MLPVNYLNHIPHPYKLITIMGCIECKNLDEISNQLLTEESFFQSFVGADEQMIVNDLKVVADKAGEVVGELVVEKIGDWLVGVLDRVADQCDETGEEGALVDVESPGPGNQTERKRRVLTSRDRPKQRI